MASISCSSSCGASPLARLQKELADQVKSGGVKPADQGAVSGALSSIEASLSASRASASSSSRPGPAEVKAKIDGLIADQVSSGALTQDQAAELKSVLQQAAPKAGQGGPGGPGGKGGPGGPGGAGGPPPGGPPPDGLPPDGSADAGGDATSSASSATSSTSSSDLLADFLKQLQASLQDGYGAKGASTASWTSLLFSVTA